MSNHEMSEADRACIQRAVEDAVYIVLSGPTSRTSVRHWLAGEIAKGIILGMLAVLGLAVALVAMAWLALTVLPIA